MSGAKTDLDLGKWVEQQRHLDPVSKYILEKLAVFADAEGCAWAKIETLAEKVNVSDRTVQTRLRKLESDGLIENTGRTHRLRNSTRSVPIYQLAPDVEGFGLNNSMGENPAPIEGYGCKSGGGMGEAAFTPKEARGRDSSPDGSLAGERAREREVFQGLEAVYPRAGFKVTDREAAWIALCNLADQGVEIERLAECAAAMDRDPQIRRRDFGPPSMQAWLTRGQYRGWWPEPAQPAPVAAPVAGGLPVEVVEALGQPFVAAWLIGAIWRGGDRTIITRLGTQAAKLRNDRRDVLQAHGLRAISAADAALQLQEATS